MHKDAARRRARSTDSFHRADQLRLVRVSYHHFFGVARSHRFFRLRRRQDRTAENAAHETNAAAFEVLPRGLVILQ
jgi:hypothetical protein